jgi:hypothetical protein
MGLPSVSFIWGKRIALELEASFLLSFALLIAALVFRGSLLDVVDDEDRVGTPGLFQFQA